MSLRIVLVCDNQFFQHYLSLIDGHEVLQCNFRARKINCFGKTTRQSREEISEADEWQITSPARLTKTTAESWGN